MFPVCVSFLRRVAVSKQLNLGGGKWSPGVLQHCPGQPAVLPQDSQLATLCKVWVKHLPSSFLQRLFGSRFPGLGCCSTKDHVAAAGRNYQAWICCWGFLGMQFLLGWWHGTEEAMGLAVHPPHPSCESKDSKSRSRWTGTLDGNCIATAMCWDHK